MIKATDEIRIRAVMLHAQQGKRASEICSAYGISDRTLRKWVSSYRSEGLSGIRHKKPGPKHGCNSISKKIQQKVVLKQKHPSWGARRIKYQYDLPCHWITVHRIIKSNGMLVRILESFVLQSRIRKMLVGIDSTGLSHGQASYYYTKRLKLRRKFLKICLSRHETTDHLWHQGATPLPAR